MIELKTNTAVWVCVGPFFDATDGVTPEIALTVANCSTTLVKETDDAAAPTLILDNVAGDDATNTLVHITGDDAGYHYLKLTAANVNFLGRAKLAIEDEATHCPVFHEIEVVSADYWNMKYGSTLLPVNATQIAGTTQDATDLADFAAAGYDPATNKVQGVVLVDTVTALSGHTAQTGDNYARLGTPAGASVSADVADVKADTSAILLDTGTDGVIVATNNDKTGYYLFDSPGIKKNTILNNFMFKMVNSSDLITPATGKTVTPTRSIDGATFASCSNAVAEVANGWYKINLSTTDLNGDEIVLVFSAPGAANTEFKIRTEA